MTNDDGQAKNQEKERVVAAISALKAQGADINPYTVSGEAQVPRSTLYRDPELMDLIYRERNGDDSSHMSSDEIQSKIAELEETNESLNEQIWDLEKQLETMTKAKQDAYFQGFQAGIEEAAKRLAAATGGETTGSHQAMEIESPVAVAAEVVAPSPAAEPEHVLGGVEFEPTPVAVGLGETNYKYGEMPAAPPSRSNGEGGGRSKKKLDENTGDYEPLSDSHIAGDYRFGDSLMGDSLMGDSFMSPEPESYAAEDKKYASAQAPEPQTAPEAARAPELLQAPEPQQAAEPQQALEPQPAPAPQPSPAAFSGEETGEHDIFDDIDSLIGEQGAAAKSPDIDFTLAQENQTAPAEPTKPEPAPKKRNFPDIDFGLSSEHEDGDSDSSNGEAHHEPVAAGARQSAPRPVEPQHAAVAAQASHAEDGSTGIARDHDGIYNIARSGPTVSSSAYNPLVELSWKDLQTVYNFSVASLKDYAKPGFGNEPGALGGTNFADSSTQQPKHTKAPPQAAPPSQAPAQSSAQSPAQSSARSKAAERPDMQEFPDPRRTGDRLQALSDPRNLLDSEPIVDLDALDIFDDLDDYVDLDKIEVISDVIAQPKSEEPSMGGDELRELIKGRIKQASEMPNEPAAPRMTTPPTSKDAKEDGKGAAPAGGARNKFIGGAKAGQEPPAAAPSFVVKQIPPEIRKACMILGLKPEDATQKSVIEAWKKQIASPGVHPDLGGDTEAAVYLNTAKDQLVRWLDQQAPKLGKKFGQAHKPEPPRPKKDED